MKQEILLTIFMVICYPILIILGGYGRLFIFDSVTYDVYTGCPKDMPLCTEEEKLRFYVGNMTLCFNTAKLVILFCIIMMSPLLFFGSYDEDKSKRKTQENVFDKFNREYRKQKNISSKDVAATLGGIDVNYGSGILLAISAATEPNYKLCKILLQFGADPNLIMDNDLIVYDTEMIEKIRLDGLFRSFGYNVRWKGNNWRCQLDFYHETL